MVFQQQQQLQQQQQEQLNVVPVNEVYEQKLAFTA